jgi:hypothetical protein
MRGMAWEVWKGMRMEVVVVLGAARDQETVGAREQDAQRRAQEVPPAATGHGRHL